MDFQGFLSRVAMPSRPIPNGYRYRGFPCPKIKNGIGDKGPGNLGLMRKKVGKAPEFVERADARNPDNP
jgi:hypothetical protein